MNKLFFRKNIIHEIVETLKNKKNKIINNSINIYHNSDITLNLENYIYYIYHNETNQ